jgi:D-arabinose 1-dehydrogenase-like Zn-dependent alcohol dehydrogenase
VSCVSMDTGSLCPFSNDLRSLSWKLTVGTEIVGTAVRVGPKVTLIKEGSRVGVGAQSYSCLQCRQCKADNETYCRHQLDTYGAVWPDTGIVSQGGYSEYVRTHEHCTIFSSLSSHPTEC